MVVLFHYFRDSYTKQLESKIQDLEARLKLYESPEYPFTQFNSLRRPDRSYISQTASDAHNASSQDHAAKDRRIFSEGEELDSDQKNDQQPPIRLSNNDALVSILNSDSSDPSKIPSSFSVVSSLLKESLLEQSKASKPLNDSCAISAATSSRLTAAAANNVSESSGTSSAPGPSCPKTALPADTDSYLLPLDINVDTFMSFPVAEPVNDEMGKKILYFLKMKNQIRFPILRRDDFEEIHNKRFERPTDPDDCEWNYNQFFLYMTYALCILSFLGVSSQKYFSAPDKLDPYSFYHRAILHARRCRNPSPLQQIRCLAMCSFFQIRQDLSRGLHWTMIDKAMNIAKRIGLHKKEQLDKFSVFEQENRLRAFWGLYQLDRLMSFERLTPYIILQKEIDIPVYANVNDNESDENVILEARKLTDKQSALSENHTSLSLSLHGLKLTIIESKITDTIYCDDKTVEEQFKYVEHFLRQLDEWKANSPKSLGYTQVVIEMFHARGVRLLLQPFIGFMEPTSPLFIRCMRQTGQIAQGCAEMSRIIKGYNLITTSMLFVSGLTLIYGLWLASKSSLNYQFIIEDIRLCTCTLYSFSERSSMFNHYRDTIDNLASATIRHVAETSPAKVPISRTVTGLSLSSESRKDNKVASRQFESFQDLTKATFAQKKDFIKFRKELDDQIEKAYKEQNDERAKKRNDEWSSFRNHGSAMAATDTKNETVNDQKEPSEKKRKLDEAAVSDTLATASLKKQKQGPTPEKTEASRIQSPFYSGVDTAIAVAERVHGIQQNPSATALTSEKTCVQFDNVIDSLKNDVQKVAPLANRFASSGSSINWWKNLEHQITSRQNCGNWISTLGTHDGVCNWIHDLSNFAKKRLNNESYVNDKTYISNLVQLSSSANIPLHLQIPDSANDNGLNGSGGAELGPDATTLAALGMFNPVSSELPQAGEKDQVLGLHPEASNDAGLDSQQLSAGPSLDTPMSYQPYEYSFDFGKTIDSPAIPTPKPLSLIEGSIKTPPKHDISALAADSATDLSFHTKQPSVSITDTDPSSKEAASLPEKQDHAARRATRPYLGTFSGRGHFQHAGIGFDNLGRLPDRLASNSAAETTKREGGAFFDTQKMSLHRGLFPVGSEQGVGVSEPERLARISNQPTRISSSVQPTHLPSTNQPTHIPSSDQPTHTPNTTPPNPDIEPLQPVPSSFPSDTALPVALPLQQTAPPLSFSAAVAPGHDPDGYPSWSWDLEMLDFDDLMTWSL